MTDPIIFIVEGNPRAKQSFRYTKGGGYANPITQAWQDTVSLRAREVMAGRDPIPGDVSVRLVFVMKTYRRVDCDNLSKCVLDGLSRIVFCDDHQVMNLHIVKRVMPKAEPGVLIEVHIGELLPFMQEQKANVDNGAGDAASK